MNTVIVPVDFSETSLNAARYAAHLLIGHYGVEMILYHAYEKETDAEKCIADLEGLKNDLFEKCPVKMTVYTELAKDFVEELEKFARHRKADLVIMGITGKSAIAQVFMGSNTLKMAETKACPVLIVPEMATYHEVKNVMLASDFKNVNSSTPSVPIKSFLETFKPSLHIVNVDENHYVAISADYEKEREAFQEMFKEFSPEFYFLRLFDIEEGLQLFAEERNIDLIILIQKVNTLRHKMFKTNIAKKLSYQATIPILIVQE
ncbi:MAG: universal stress protein [Bacteroidetes bacterium]|nr:universal stress protein [Bacteroidota bacterium]